VAIPAIAKPVKYLPDGIVEAMIDNDFEWAANSRLRILKEWRRRYDSKSEPKN
jgi:iron(III) transport system substrate-binding protein